MNALLMLMLAADPAGSAEPEILLLDFTASYCQPCQQMLPSLQRMERDGYPVRRIDITQEHNLSRQYGVERIPTLVLLVQGREVKRFVGLTSESELRREMKNAALALQPASPATAVAATSAAAEENVITAEVAPAEKPRRRSFAEILGGLFGAGKDAGNEPTTIRGQDPGTASGPSEALVTAFAATVRIRVSDGKREDVASGTIIQSAAGESIILTCAHLFAGFSRDAAVEVDVFHESQARSYPARICGGDHNSDLAVIRIQNAEPLPAVRLSPQAAVLAAQQQLVSFGCDGGDVPRPLQTRVSKLKPYLGADNLTCDVPPAKGRSGGGLFSLDGTLIGVCSAADPERTEGLYTGHEAVLQLLDHCQLAAAVIEQPAVSPGLDATFGSAMDHAMAQGTPSTQPAPEAQTSGGVFTDNATGANPTEAAIALAGPAPEITVVIDPKTPGGQKRIVIIPQATPWLVELLTGEAQGGAAPETVASR